MPTPDELLARYPPRIRALALRLRELVRGVMPGAAERVNPGWRSLGYHHPEAGYVCGIFPFEDEVRLLFEHGAALADPEGVLTGHTRQVKWIPVRTARDIRVRPIRALLAAAIADGIGPGAAPRRRRTRSSKP